MSGLGLPEGGSTEERREALYREAASIMRRLTELEARVRVLERPIGGRSDGLEVTNEFMVGVRGDSVVVMRPGILTSPLTRSRALMLAAYLVALAEPLEVPATDPGRLRPFSDFLAAVENT